MKKLSRAGVCLLVTLALVAGTAQAQQYIDPPPDLLRPQSAPADTATQPAITDEPLQQGIPAPAPPANQPMANGQRGELGVWLGASGGPGVEIRRITEGSAAHQSGLRTGDVILQVNGKGATSPQMVSQLVREIAPGQVATLHVWRDGELQEMKITVQPVRVSQPQRNPYEVAFRGDESEGATGGSLSDRTARLEQQFSQVIQQMQQLRKELDACRAGMSPSTNQPTYAPGAPQSFPEPTLAPSPEPAQPDAATPAPASTQPAESAAESDPFGDTSTVEQADAEVVEPTPAETEPEPEPATETETDPLFQ